MSKHIQGNKIANATSYELYENGTQGVTMKLIDVPGIVFYKNKTPTQTSHEFTDSTSATGGYAFDLPLQEGYSYHIEGAARAWTLDANKNGLNTFNMTNDKQGIYTAVAGDVYLRTAVGNVTSAIENMTITITGSQVKRSVQSADAIPVVEAPDFVFYDKKSPTSSSADLSENDTWWCCDMTIEPNKTYVFSEYVNATSWAARCWTFDSQGNAKRTFNIRETNGRFTAGDDEVKLRVGSGYTQDYVYDKTYHIEGATLENIDFDLSKRYYANGNHVLSVKAKADGKEDSDYSNAVTYTV